MDESIQKRQAKQFACVKWLLSKAYNNHVPQVLKEPFYYDDKLPGGVHLKPNLVYCLANAELYCLALANIYSDPNYQNLNHFTIMQVLARKGICLTCDNADSQLTETVLIQTSPLKLSAHICVIEGIMLLYAKEVATAERITAAIERFPNEKIISLDNRENGLLLWINQTIHALRNEIISTSCSADQNVERLCDALNRKFVDWIDLSDGVGLAALISFYCAKALPWNNIVPLVKNEQDRIFNLTLVYNFCNFSLPYPIFHVAGQHLTYFGNKSMRATLMALLADLFNLLEIHPASCVHSSSENGQTANGECAVRNSHGVAHKRFIPMSHQQQQHQIAVIPHLRTTLQSGSSNKSNFNNITNVEKKTADEKTDESGKKFVVHKGRSIPTLSSMASTNGGNEKVQVPSQVAAGKPTNWQTSTFSGRRSRRNSFSDDSQLTIENFGGSQENIHLLGRNPDKEQMVYKQHDQPDFSSKQVASQEKWNSVGINSLLQGECEIREDYGGNLRKNVAVAAPFMYPLANDMEEKETRKGGNVIDNHMRSIQMQLEEKRRHIENEKRKAEANLSRRRQNLGKAAILQALSKIQKNVAMKVDKQEFDDSINMEQDEHINTMPIDSVDEITQKLKWLNRDSNEYYGQYVGDDGRREDRGAMAQNYATGSATLISPLVNRNERHHQHEQINSLIFNNILPSNEDQMANDFKEHSGHPFDGADKQFFLHRTNTASSHRPMTWNGDQNVDTYAIRNLKTPSPPSPPPRRSSNLVTTPSVNDMAPQSISFIGLQNDSNNLNNSGNRLQINSGSRTYRIPSSPPVHAAYNNADSCSANVSSNSSQIPLNSSEKGFYVSLDDGDNWNNKGDESTFIRRPMRGIGARKPIKSPIKTTKEPVVMPESNKSVGVNLSMPLKKTVKPDNIIIPVGTNLDDDEMERKKERILLSSLQRRQQQEEMKARKELQMEKKKEIEKEKADELARKKEEEKIRRKEILERHMLKKALEQAEREGKTVDKSLLNALKNHQQNHQPPTMTRMRMRNRSIDKGGISNRGRIRPKTIHIDSSSAAQSVASNLSPSGSSTMSNGKTNTMSSSSMRRDYYRGSQDCLVTETTRTSTPSSIYSDAADEVISSSSYASRRGSYKGTQRDVSLDRVSSRSHIARPKFATSYQSVSKRKSTSLMNLSDRNDDTTSLVYGTCVRSNSGNVMQGDACGPGSLPPSSFRRFRFDDTVSESGAAEYTGPRLYKQPATKSNRSILLNAVEYCVFPGAVNKNAKDRVLDEMNKSDAKHFLILFRDAKCQFRALYSYTPENESIVKLYGTGPKQVTDTMFEKFFKYNSGGKCFSQIHTKHLTVTIDAFTIHNSLWQGKKMNLPNKRDMTLVI